jgi:hypothetical protein
MPALARLGAAVETSSVQGDFSVIETVLPATCAHDLQRQLPRLTGGEGVLESTFAGYQPVSGDQPTRGRTTPNPLNLAEYLRHLAGTRCLPHEVTGANNCGGGDRNADAAPAHVPRAWPGVTAGRRR